MFQNAKPVWPKGRSREKNVFAAFALQAGPALPDGKLSLHVAGATFYRVYVDGAFLGFGPARTAFGYAREDVFSLARPESGNIHVVIEVCGYYCRSLSTVLQPSFLMADRLGHPLYAHQPDPPGSGPRVPCPAARECSRRQPPL